MGMDKQSEQLDAHEAAHKFDIHAPPDHLMVVQLSAC